MNISCLSGLAILLITTSLASPASAVIADPNSYNSKFNPPIVQPSAPPPAPTYDVIPPPSAAGYPSVASPLVSQPVPNTNVMQATPTAPPSMPSFNNPRDPQNVIDKGINAPRPKELQDIVDRVPNKKPTRDEMIYRVNLGRAADIEILLKNGASPNEINANGVPIIALAASRTDSESIEIIKVLLANGADINMADKRSQNALFYAAKIGNKEVVEYLLENKIKYTALDSAGNNARVIAYQTGHNAIIEILDNFVRQQNNEVRQQYAQVNRELQDRYNAYNAAIIAQNQKNNEIYEQRKKNRMQELVHEIAFASCASAYWKYCLDSKQETQFGTINLNNNIKSQTSRMRDFINIIANEQKVSKATVDPVIKGSAEKIVQKLQEFASNQARSADGVGTIDDMKMRCNIIAESWQTKKENEQIAPGTQGIVPNAPALNQVNSAITSPTIPPASPANPAMR